MNLRKLRKYKIKVSVKFYIIDLKAHDEEENYNTDSEVLKRCRHMPIKLANNDKEDVINE